MVDGRDLDPDRKEEENGDAGEGVHFGDAVDHFVRHRFSLVPYLQNQKYQRVPYAAFLISSIL